MVDRVWMGREALGVNRPTLLVAGASGALGKAVCGLALSRGFKVRALGRNQAKLKNLGVSELVVGDAVDPAILERATGGVDLVLSCLGASVSPELKAGSKTFSEVDAPINCSLIDASERAKVKKFVYVSVGAPESLHQLEYVRNHELVASHLERSKLDHAIIQPTGFFSAFASILEFAKKGSVPVLGNPDAKTNPIDDGDLAEVCVEALVSDFGKQKVGGPEVLSRRHIAELAFEALGRPAKLRRVPSWLVSGMATAIGLLNPRVRDITRFYLAASSVDCIAEPRGTRRIAEYFSDLAGA